MKNILAICFVVLGTSVFAQGKVKVKISWIYTGIIENYDHDNRMEIYLDGKSIATSTISKQSRENSITVKIPKGTHTLKAVNYAEYKGAWEEHTQANNYSLDAVYSIQQDFRKKQHISLVFDITSETVRVK